MAILSEAQRLQVAGGTVRAGILLRVGTPNPLRIWGGVGDLRIPADTIEAAEATYSGMGEMMNAPAVSQLVNGVADQVTFTLSGVSQEILSLVDEEADQVRFVSARLGFVPLNEDWQRVGGVLWLWQGLVETSEVSQSAATAEQEASRAISLTVSTGLTTRRRPQHAYFTDPDQRRRSADDRFCERTPFYSQGATRKFGPV